MYVNELSSNEDLAVLVHSYLSSVQVSDDVVQGIIKCVSIGNVLCIDNTLYVCIYLLNALLLRQIACGKECYISNIEAISLKL